MRMVGAGLMFVNAYLLYVWAYLFTKTEEIGMEHHWTEYGMLGFIIFLVAFGLIMMFGESYNDYKARKRENEYEMEI